MPIQKATGPDTHLEAVHRLSLDGVPVNVTAILTREQAFCAALTGASFVSLFGGRLIEYGGDPAQQISVLRQSFDRVGLASKIIATSIREIPQALNWLGSGADFVTLRPEHLFSMLTHSGSREIASRFLDSAMALRGRAE